MKKSFKFYFSFLLIFTFSFITSCSNNSMKPEDFKNKEPRLVIEKYLSVSLSEAEEFKSTIENIAISHTYKPYIINNSDFSAKIVWEKDYKPLVLSKKDSRDILPWVYNMIWTNVAMRNVFDHMHILYAHI